MDDFFNALPRLVWHEDEPITWPSSVSLYFVSKLACEQVKVVLTGEGSDEMFGGYARYRYYAMNQRWLRLYGILPEPLRSAMRNAVPSRPLLSADPAPQAAAHVRRPRRGPRIAVPRQFLLRLLRRRAARLIQATLPVASPYATFRDYLEFQTAISLRSRACSSPTRRPTWSNC